MSTLKFIKPAKYDTYMFAPVNITESQSHFFNIKSFKDNKYIFLKQKKIKSKNELIKGAIYSVDINDWVHNKFYNVRYTLKLVEKPSVIFEFPEKKSQKCLFSYS